MNALLYSRAQPMPGDGDTETGRQAERPRFDESLDACNPDNFPDFFDDEVIVRR